MPDERNASLEPCEIADKLWQDYIGTWRPYYIAMTQEEAYLGGERYKDDGGRYAKDRRLVQIVGPETQTTIDHIVAKVFSAKRSTEARPVDEDEDPDSAEAAVAILEWDGDDPHIGLNRELYLALKRACEMRRGYVAIDWDPNCGPFGARIYTEEDPRNYMHDPCYHPHHPLCGWMIRTRRIDVDQIHETWDGSEWVKPDHEAQQNEEWMRQGGKLIDRMGDPMIARMIEDNKATIRECWYKNDRTYSDKTTEKDRRPLKPEDQYLLCVGIPGLQPQCGYRSPKFGMLMKDVDGDGIPDKEYPEQMMQGCPTCGGDLDRIDALAEDAYRLKYEKGRRLVITAPYSPNPKKQCVYDDKWPIPRARSFPIFVIDRNVKPGRITGPSDVWTMMPQQTAADQLDTLAVQRIFEHRTIIITPAAGVTDSSGRRIQLREDQHNVYYRDATVFAKFGPNNIEKFDTAGIDPNWGGVRDRINAKLTQFRPQLDLGPAEKNTRDIAVGSIEIQQQEAEVTTEDFKQRFHEALSVFNGIRWDYIKATLSEEQITRLRLGGVDLAKAISGDDLPNHDFTVFDSPDFTGLEEAKAKAFGALLQGFQQAASMGLDPIKYIEAYAKYNNMPRSVVRAFQDLISDAQQRKEEAMIQEIDASDPEDPTGTGLPDEDLAALAGVNGNGKPQPQAVAA